MQSYENISGYEYDPHARNAITLAGRETTPDAAFITAEINRFNIGHNTADARIRAADAYGTAVHRLITQPIDMGMFILGRAEDVVDIDDDIRRAIINSLTENTNIYKPKIVNDPQNVHDSKVVSDLAKIYGKIKSRNTSDLPTYENISSFIHNKSAESPQRKRDALRALNIMYNEGHSLESIHETEHNVLRNVWARAYAEENTKNSEDIKNSIVCSLADCIENNSPVCITGRCSRVISSLTAMDANKEIAAPPVTKDIMKAEIFGKAGEIVESWSAKMPADIKKKYDDGDESDPDVALQINEVKDQIRSKLKEKYTNVEPAFLDQCIRDAQAGV